MSIINITNINVLNNPALFQAPFALEVTFECVAPLQEDAEFKLIYVGSAESETYDQVLDSVLVGPIPVGVSKFVLQADPPKSELIPKDDLLGVTVILLTCSYRDQEFIRIGYYVNNYYGEEALNEAPPPVPRLELIYKNILHTKPRVTKINITWDEPAAPAAPQPVAPAAFLGGLTGENVDPATFFAPPPGPLTKALPSDGLPGMDMDSIMS